MGDFLQESTKSYKKTMKLVYPELVEGGPEKSLAPSTGSGWLGIYGYGSLRLKCVRLGTLFRMKDVILSKRNSVIVLNYRSPFCKGGFNLMIKYFHHSPVSINKETSKPFYV